MASKKKVRRISPDSGQFFRFRQNLARFRRNHYSLFVGITVESILGKGA
jgi:hypothetical protein